MTLKMTLKWMAVLIGGLLASQVSAEEMPVLKTQKDKVSYGIGVDVGRNFKRQGIEVDGDLLTRGLKDALSGAKLLMSDDDLRSTLNAYQGEFMRKRSGAMQAAAEEDKKAGDAFLAENKKKEGVVTLPSGVQYRIIKAGEGKKPTDADTVECRYRGTLINGTEFDNSERSGKPTVSLEMKGLIAGCREVLKLMPVGSTWQIFIPPELAYGLQGSGRDIGPNMSLIFEMELVAIK